jgi:dTDP-4-dehydrorhamnose reductase
MTKQILITGANGQLGNELQQLMEEYPAFCFFPTDVDTLDLSQQSQIADFIETNSIEYVINCAAYTAVDKAEEDTEACFRVNRDCVRNLANAAAGKAKIIHISTDYVFDGKNTIPYKETDPVNPQSVYGQSKLDGERILLTLGHPAIIIRTSWLYSAFGNNFVKTMLRLGHERERLNVVADQFGTPTYAADLAECILKIITFCETHQRFPAGIYHYSNEGVCSWYDFALKIHQLAGIDTCKIIPVATSEYPVKAMRPIYSVLDKTMIKTTFGLTIPHWEDSLSRCISSLSRRS